MSPNPFAKKKKGTQIKHVLRLVNGVTSYLVATNANGLTNQTLVC